MDHDTAVHDSSEETWNDLMRRAQEGDAAAYENLLRGVHTLVRDYARRRLPDVTAADDVAQDTLMTLHAARHTYDPRRPFFPWLYAIANHRLLDHARKRQRIRLREVSGDEALIAGAVAPAADAPHPLAETVRQLLAELPERSRRIIELLKIEEYSVPEVARLLHLSESNVKVIAHRGYREIRRRLEGGQR
jgi:RNA polymerase sigma-70 factor (ECF subfamily)